jgi:hypothetical protein|tara:strand:- start:761 stop:1513 length:753 start_codon:yes stop_codon:yes gene_type:complete
MSDEAQVAVAEGVEPIEETQGSLLQTQEVSVERPEWLPEKFKSPEDLATAYNSLETKLGSSKEEAVKAYQEEIDKEAFANRPATAGEYQIPEVLDVTNVADNKLLNWWADHSFSSGFSQEEFEEGIQLYITENGAKEQGPVYEEELKRLGDNATARTESVGLFAQKFFPEKSMPAIQRMCETADGIIALEHIMENMKTAQPMVGSSSVGRLDEATLQSMMQDERYHNPAKREKSFVQSVENGFKQLYGRS